MTDFDLSFELKLEQKIPMNCLLEVRDVFAVMPTGCGKSFFLAVTAKKNTLTATGQHPQRSNKRVFEKKSI